MNKIPTIVRLPYPLYFNSFAYACEAEKIKNWDGKYNWQPSSLDSMLRNEKYMGDTILQKSYTADFLSKRRVMNNGALPKYHIKRDHEPIIDIETWEAVQAEHERRASTVRTILQMPMHSVAR